MTSRPVLLLQADVDLEEPLIAVSSGFLEQEEA